MASEKKRTRRNTLERKCLGKAFKRLFANSPKGVFKMLEKVKRVSIGDGKHMVASTINPHG